jgi:hypothetical protein
MRCAFTPNGFALLVAILFAFAADNARAQAPVPEAIKATAGAWEISNADRDKTCIVHLKADPAPGGAKLELDTPCATVFPMLKDAAAWSVLNEVLRLLDAKGKTLMMFTEVESGIYESERPGEGLYFLQNVAAVGQAERKPDQLVGDWTFMRANKAICVVTLSMTRAGDDKFALKVKPGCDAFIGGFGPAAWRMDRDELVLISTRAEEWRFEENEPGSWRRIPENVDPVQLVRK